MFDYHHERYEDSPFGGLLLDTSVVKPFKRDHETSERAQYELPKQKRKITDYESNRKNMCSFLPSQR